MPLVLESDKDADSILRFDLVCDEMGGGVCLVNCQPVPSPARVLVFRPASLTQSSADEFVDVRAVVAIGFDVEGAEVVLKDLVGHAVTVMVVLLLFSFGNAARFCSAAPYKFLVDVYVFKN